MQHRKPPDPPNPDHMGEEAAILPNPLCLYCVPSKYIAKTPRLHIYFKYVILIDITYFMRNTQPARQPINQVVPRYFHIGISMFYGSGRTVGQVIWHGPRKSWFSLGEQQKFQRPNSWFKQHLNIKRQKTLLAGNLRLESGVTNKESCVQITI